MQVFPRVTTAFYVEKCGCVNENIYTTEENKIRLMYKPLHSHNHSSSIMNVSSMFFLCANDAVFEICVPLITKHGKLERFTRYEKPAMISWWRCYWGTS